MSGSPSIYWYDLETFGIDPKKDRIAQFAGLRTDPELNVISDPLVMFCKPARDMLPSPESCLVTGITPQQALQDGIPEAAFIARVNDEFSRPDTCVCGYNNIRFDDEFVRYSLYRNFFDPYEREWKNGNSRWDIIDMVRLTRALRPDGIEWPWRDDGLPSFRLEDLTVANHIEHAHAHDALSDIHATIAIAKLIRDKQRKLFDFVFSLRSKHQVAMQFNVKEHKPVVHVSGMFPSRYFCATVVAPITMHPSNKNGVIVYDLREDPAPLLDLSIEEIQKRVFSPKDDLAEDEARVPLKTIHMNKCPVVVPLTTLDNESQGRIQLDMDACQRHLAVLQNNPQLEKKISQVFHHKGYTPTDDPDQQLYQGFFDAADKGRMQEIRSCAPDELAQREFFFNDKRLPELLFRYRARNWPDSLNEHEVQLWKAYCQQRVTDPDGGNSITLQEFNQRLDELSNAEDTTALQQTVIATLREYAQSLFADTSN
jgi:exodeoxyribonuclease-1